MDILLVVQRLVEAAKTAVSTPALALTGYDYVPDGDLVLPCVFPEAVSTVFDQTHGRGTDKIRVCRKCGKDL